MKRQVTSHFLLIRTSNMIHPLRNLHTHHLNPMSVKKKTGNKVATKNEYFTMGHALKTKVKEKGN